MKPQSETFDFSRAQPSDSEVLNRLLGLYMHDMSEWFDVLPDDQADFGLRCDEYFQSNHPVFIARADDRPIGFALVKAAVPPSAASRDFRYELDEFFVMRGHRTRGVGTGFAHHIWNELPGEWIIRVLERNAPAVSFWRLAIETYVMKATEATPKPAIERHQWDAKTWVDFRFCNGQGMSSAP
ncbi:MAG: GNAT family N-acetyltransferase [Proteobacteria bacterium]|nr:GNAT family N-acetyltransferase [Pseudomonadota bacterium]MDA1299062.1 GNAT family N-acetyltransferase [Pseudomonadota bacterium]